MGTYEEIPSAVEQDVKRQPQWNTCPSIGAYSGPVKPWEADFFSCFQDFGLCCDVLLCFPCMQGRIYSAVVDQRPNHMHPLVCCAFVSLGLMDTAGDMARIGFLWWMRARVREVFRIEGSATMDCLTATFCMPCLTCQLHRELSAHGMNPGYTCCQPDTYDLTPDLHQPIAPVQPGYTAVPPTAGQPSTKPDEEV